MEKYFFDNLEFIISNKELDFGMLNASTFGKRPYPCVFLSKNNEPAGVLSIRSSYSQIYTTHYANGYHTCRIKRKIYPNKVNIKIEFPDYPVDPDANQGFIGEDEYFEGNFFYIFQFGNYEEHLKIIKNCMNLAKQGKDSKLILPPLIQKHFYT